MSKLLNTRSFFILSIVLWVLGGVSGAFIDADMENGWLEVAYVFWGTGAAALAAFVVLAVLNARREAKDEAAQAELADSLKSSVNDFEDWSKQWQHHSVKTYIEELDSPVNVSYQNHVDVGVPGKVGSPYTYKVYTTSARQPGKKSAAKRHNVKKKKASKKKTATKNTKSAKKVAKKAPRKK